MPIAVGPRRGLILVVLALVLAAPACASKEVRTVRVQRAGVAVAPTPSPPPTYLHPLTGSLFTGSQDWQSRPVLAIKIENLPSARPQAGLDSADVVYEELAEGGITRFIALFQSRGAPLVGPVRSARRVDPDVLAAVGGLFAYAGGVPPVIQAVRATPDITDVSVNRAPDAYYRRAGRQAPHNLYTSSNALWTGRGGAPPPSLFSFRDPAVPLPPGAAGRTAAFSFSSFAASEQMRYEYDPATTTYRRFHGSAPHALEGGAQVAPANVILQLVSVTSGTTVDVNGLASPESQVTGEGEAILLTGGQAYRGRWVRPTLRDRTRFIDAAGNPLLLSRGQTWVELLPSNRGVSLG